MPADVEIFAAWNCPYCIRAKRLLRKKGAAFRNRPVWLLPFGFLPTRNYREMVERAGRDSVPQIFIGGCHVGGCDDLLALDARGELDALLRPSER